MSVIGIYEFKEARAAFLCRWGWLIAIIATSLLGGMSYIGALNFDNE